MEPSVELQLKQMSDQLSFIIDRIDQLKVSSKDYHPEYLLCETEVLSLLKCSRTLLFQMVRDDQFPPPDLDKPRRWRVSTYNKWVREHNKGELCNDG